MLERLTNLEEIENAERLIKELIEAHGEWFYVPPEGERAQPLAVHRSEIDLHEAHGRLIFSCWTEKGTRFWRIRGWEWTGAKLLLDAVRRAGAERTVIELIPRASTRAVNAMISAARRERAGHLARLAARASKEAGISIERVGLSLGARRGQPGRAARIQLRSERERIAVTGVVTPGEAYDVDSFLSGALVWFMRARDEAACSPLIVTLWLIADRKHIGPLAESVALLREDLRRAISLHEIDDGWRELKPVRCPQPEALWAGERERFHRPTRIAMSEWAVRIAALAPDAIDVVRARHGETLRYFGLPFARVRRLMGVERVWFGTISAQRRLLDESTAADCANLLQQLTEHRRADAPDQRHAFYKGAPEAWLESMLRRDITRLDPGLIIAPLYAQFRTSQSGSAGASRPVDLLALRRDGRLVVIELKVSEDREHVLQAANYWRRVEAHRRWGNIARTRLFGDELIMDESPLVYLVAPTLRFHRSFATLARAVDPRIEIYRFDINENWRAGIRVMRRIRAN